LQYASDKDAGFYSAILAIDPERPFKSRGGKTCKTSEDIADAIMAESAYYMEKDSMLLVWLSDIYGDDLKSTDAFDNLNTSEKSFLLGLFPYIFHSLNESGKNKSVLPRFVR